MALVTVASFKAKDHRGKSRTVPFFFAQTATLSAIQSAMDDIISAYDAMADAQVIESTVHLALTLPSGIKSSPASGNTVNEGALTNWSAANSSNTHGIFFPAIAETSWSGDVLTAGSELTALQDAVEVTRNEAGEFLNGYNYSERKVRK